MKLNTHDRTPRPKMSKHIKVLFVVCSTLSYGIFALMSFACFYYAQNIVAGLLVIVLPIYLTLLVLIPSWDMNKAYIEINGNNIRVVDYYCGVKKEKHISLTDVTSAVICNGYSHKVKGYRYNLAVMRYIVFQKDKKYLFKIIYLPETEEIFKPYL